MQIQRKTQRSFRQSIQNAVFFNALLPMLILTISGIVLTTAMLYGSTKIRLTKYNKEVVELVNRMYICYTEQLKALSEREDLARELMEGHISIQSYQELYDFVNSAPVRAEFYLTDAEYRILGSSTMRAPFCLTENGIQTSPIWRRSRSDPEKVSVAGENNKDESRFLFAFGIGDVYNPSGYVLFEIKWKDFYRLFTDSYNLVITDEYYYSFWNNSTLLLDSYRRVDMRMRMEEGMVHHEGQKLFIVRSEAFGGKVIVYTYADITGYFSIYSILIPVLVLIFVGMLVFLFAAARRAAGRTGEVVDRIARMMENTQYETLDEPLCINTGNELEKIADAYNRMCREMHRLIDDNVERAKQQAISEIRQLEAQFNPHFLFNTLETIRVFVKVDPERARDAIVALSGILRYSIDNTMMSVQLKEEVYYAECYLQIQKDRLQKNLEYCFLIDEETEKYIVPKLILQPLVENAVQYGKSQDGCCSIEIRCKTVFRAAASSAEISGEANEKQLLIEVQDMGTPLSDESISDIRNMLELPYNITSHIGLYNVHKRIRLAYGDAYGVVFGRSACGIGNTFTVILPVRTEGVGDV